jgi:small-conductance mechanosensitive channel
MSPLSLVVKQFANDSLRLLTDPQQWYQVGALALAVAGAVLLSLWIRRFAQGRYLTSATGSAQFMRVALRRALVPAVLSLLALLGVGALKVAELPATGLQLVAVLSLSLVVVRLLVHSAGAILRPGPVLAALERLITWVIWVFVALYLLGWLGDVAATLDSVYLPIGGKHISLLDAGRLIATLLVFMLGAFYIGTLVERRVMAATDISIGIRVGVTKFTRFSLMILAGLVALESLGINFTTLAVFGGAIGVGVGFGLQRIISNFISGFILVVDRSIRQGDVITIGSRFGVVRELRARYIVVHDRDGVDTLIPNENLVTSEVVNWSYGDRLVRLKLPIGISYTDDPRKAIKILTASATAHPRVEKTPEPAARIIGFGNNSINLELRFWIHDPEGGVTNVRSDLYLAIWDAFKAAGITIPYPQRDLHLRTGWPQTAPTGDSHVN